MIKISKRELIRRNKKLEELNRDLRKEVIYIGAHLYHVQPTHEVFKEVTDEFNELIQRTEKELFKETSNADTENNL